ncbi:hypothetical protein ACF0H5_022157 [Mactra antiquata]
MIAYTIKGTKVRLSAPVHSSSDLVLKQTYQQSESMKSLATLLSLAVLVGLATCMSIVEYEEDDVSKNIDLGWLFHFHFHFHPLEDDKQEVLGCTGNPCYLCKKSAFDVSLFENMASANYEYNGCLVITKTPDEKFKVGVTLDDELQYENVYENLIGDETLPCIYPNEPNRDGRICPHIYKADLKNGRMCASLDEYLQFQDTKMRHENNLGCAEIY